MARSSARRRFRRHHPVLVRSLFAASFIETSSLILLTRVNRHCCCCLRHRPHPPVRFRCCFAAAVEAPAVPCRSRPQRSGSPIAGWLRASTRSTAAGRTPLVQPEPASTCIQVLFLDQSHKRCPRSLSLPPSAPAVRSTSLVSCD